MIKKLGLQLYSVKGFIENEQELRETFRKLREFGYTQIQTIRCKVPYAVFGTIALEEGIEIIGTHDSFDLMVEDFEQSLENHRWLRTPNMGIGYRNFESAKEVESFIVQANQVAKRAAEAGMKFTYHHHHHEFRRWENGKTTFDMLIEGLDPVNTSFVLDTFWIQRAGGEIRAWLEKLAGRVDILHLKDMKIELEPESGRYLSVATEVGGGNMNWELILETAQRTGVRYYVVEQDDNCSSECFPSIRKSAEYLKQFQNQNYKE